MAYFDRHPHTFRILYAILVAYTAILFAYGVMVRQSRATDDNVWETAPSDIIISHLPDIVPAVATKPMRGDFIVRVQDIRVYTRQEADSIIQRASHNDSLRFNLRSLLSDKPYTLTLKKQHIPADFFRSIPHGVRIGDITPNGVSERAGLKIGDIIYRINGEDVINSKQAQDILLSNQAGANIIYDVTRLGEPLTFTLTTSSVGISFDVLVSYLLGLMMLGISGVFVFTRSYMRPARLLALNFFSVGAAVMLTRTPPVYDQYGFINMATWVTEWFLASAFAMHTIHAMNDEKNRQEPSLVPWIYGVTIGLALLFIMGLAVGMSISGNIMPVSIILWGAYMIARRVLYKQFFPTQQAMYLGRAVFFIALLMSSEYMITKILSGILTAVVMSTELLIRSTPSSTVQLYERITTLMNIIRLSLIVFVPTAFFSMIFKYHIFHLVWRIRRNVQYIFASLSWNMIIISLFMIGMWWMALLRIVLPTIQIHEGIVEVLYDPALASPWSDKFATCALAVGWVLGIRTVRKRGLQIIDAKFDRQQYDYRRAAGELTDTLGSNITTESIAGAIVNTIAQQMLLRKVGVLLYRDSEQTPCVADSAGLSEEEHSVLIKHIDDRFHSAIAKYTGDSRLSVVSLPGDIARDLSALGFRYVMPIRNNKWMSGILLIGEKKSEAAFNREDFAFMSAFVRQCTIALDNALLYEQLTEQQRLEHELNIARDIQLMSLPQHTPDIKGLDIAGASVPAMEVGGDFYDYLVYEEHEMMVVVGDVSGKGTSAALYMSKAQGIMRTLRDFHLSPRDLFNRMNQLIYEELHRRSFITALSGLFHTQLNAMVLARAGHLPLFHYRAETFAVEQYQPKGIGLGITSQKHFFSHLQLQRIDYNVGDVFVFVTDGITEARNEAQEEFGEEALLNTIILNAQYSAEAIRNAIIESTVIFRGIEKQFDDMTVVVIKISEK